jgi:hypothetical protein
MTHATTDIDYAVVFEEQSTLNRLFSAHRGSSAPTPNPAHFERVPTDTMAIIIFFGKRSRTYFMAETDFTYGLNTYGRFSPAETRERTVTDWVWV